MKNTDIKSQRPHFGCSLAMAAALCLTAGHVQAAGYGTWNSQLDYYDDDTSITITSASSGIGTSVNIPASINGKPVIAIGENGLRTYSVSFQRFYGSGVSNVTIPSSVTSIGTDAFNGCQNLTSITIPSSVANIGTYAFANCTNMKSVVISNGLTNIGDHAFSRCAALSSVKFPSTVASIGDSVFQDCTALTSVTIPAGATVIGNVMFQNCTSLTGIALPTSLTKIGAAAFNGCTALTSIKIPAKVAAIEDETFLGCTALRSASIPGGTKTIGFHAFADCTSLNSISLPVGLADIGSEAFIGCTGMKSLTISPGPCLIGDGAFQDCTLLQTAVLGEGISDIGTGAFSATGLTNLLIPTTVVNIANSAFQNCSALAGATFLGNAPVMGTLVFDGAAPTFKITFLNGKTGFKSPKWLGYPCFPINPAPEIEIKLGAKIQVDNSSTVRYGTVLVGSNTTSKTFLLTNLGTAPLTGLAISIDGVNAGDFIASSIASTVAPGATTKFKLTFAPKAAGTRTAAIHISSNDGDENPFDMKIGGAGVP